MRHLAASSSARTNNPRHLYAFHSHQSPFLRSSAHPRAPPTLASPASVVFRSICYRPYLRSLLFPSSPCTSPDRRRRISTSSPTPAIVLISPCFAGRLVEASLQTEGQSHVNQHLLAEVCLLACRARSSLVSLHFPLRGISPEKSSWFPLKPRRGLPPEAKSEASD